MSIQVFATLLFSERARAALLIVFNAYEIFVLLSGLVFLPLLYYVLFVVVRFVRTPYLALALVWFFRNLLLVPVKIPIVCSIISIFVLGYWAGTADNLLYTEMRNLFEACVNERMEGHSRTYSGIYLTPFYQNVQFACEQYVDPMRLVPELGWPPYGWFTVSPLQLFRFILQCFYYISLLQKQYGLHLKYQKNCFVIYENEKKIASLCKLW